MTLEIANRHTGRGHLRVELSGIDAIGATANAWLGESQIARDARVIEIPAALRHKAPAEFTHMFYATDGSQALIALKADEMTQVRQEIEAYEQEIERLANLL